MCGRIRGTDARPTQKVVHPLPGPYQAEWDGGLELAVVLQDVETGLQVDRVDDLRSVSHSTAAEFPP